MISFTPNKKFLEAYCQSFTDQIIAYLKELADKTFSINLEGRLYALRYEIDDQGLVSIYVLNRPASQSLILPTLQLNIGSLLLPESIDLEGYLPGAVAGLNPGVQQTPFHEVYEGSLSPTEVQAIMAKISEIGFLKIIRSKNSPK